MIYKQLLFFHIVDMDPSMTMIELRYLAYVGKFFYREIACRKITNSKMHLFSGLSTVLCVYAMGFESKNSFHHPLLMCGSFAFFTSFLLESLLLWQRLERLRYEFFDKIYCDHKD